MPAGTARNLSVAERLRVGMLAQAGRVDEAIGEYLRAVLDDEEPLMEMVNSPEYVDVCNDAVFAVFEETQLDYSLTMEHQSYLMRYAGSRPL